MKVPKFFTDMLSDWMGEQVHQAGQIIIVPPQGEEWDRPDVHQQIVAHMSALFKGYDFSVTLDFPFRPAEGFVVSGAQYRDRPGLDPQNDPMVKMQKALDDFRPGCLH